MSNTFIKLPTGDIEIDHIREVCIDLSFTRFEFIRWKSRPALIEKNGKMIQLYTGQKFDPNYFDLVEDGWMYDECEVCFMSIGEHQNQYKQTEGYFNGGVWVCESCYKTLIAIDDLEKKLAELPQYQK